MTWMVRSANRSLFFSEYAFMWGNGMRFEMIQARPFFHNEEGVG